MTHQTLFQLYPNLEVIPKVRLSCRSWDANIQCRSANVQTIMVCCHWLTCGSINLRVSYYLLLKYFLMTLTLILNLNDPKVLVQP